jgi:death-on-curing protein
VRFPTAGALLDLHARILAKTGGEPGVLNATTIASAIERARWGPFLAPPDLFDRAALLLRGLCEDHPFADGNKRTAFEATDLFLLANGSGVGATADEVHTFMLEVAQGQHDVPSIAAWLRAHPKGYPEGEAIE